MGFTPCESVFPTTRNPPELLNPLLINPLLTYIWSWFHFLPFEQKKGASRLTGRQQRAQDECRCSPIDKTSPAETRASDAGHHDTRPGVFFRSFVRPNLRQWPDSVSQGETPEPEPGSQNGGSFQGPPASVGALLGSFLNGIAPPSRGLRDRAVGGDVQAPDCCL